MSRDGLGLLFSSILWGLGRPWGTTCDHLWETLGDLGDTLGARGATLGNLGSPWADFGSLEGHFGLFGGPPGGISPHGGHFVCDLESPGRILQIFRNYS